MAESRARRRIREAVELFGYRLVSLDWEPLGIVVEKSGQEGGWIGFVERPDGGIIRGRERVWPRERQEVLGYNVEHVLDWIDEFVQPVEPCACVPADPIARKRAQLQTHGPDCRYHLTYRLPWFRASLVRSA